MTLHEIIGYSLITFAVLGLPIGLELNRRKHHSQTGWFK
jgi:hypothetical protein